MVILEESIKTASELIAIYNKPLAVKFLKEPFQRVNMARAFSKGFVKNPEDDAPSFCYDILKIALLDKEYREN